MVTLSYFFSLVYTVLQCGDGYVYYKDTVCVILDMQNGPALAVWVSLPLVI